MKYNSIRLDYTLLDPVLGVWMSLVVQIELVALQNAYESNYTSEQYNFDQSICEQ